MRVLLAVLIVIAIALAWMRVAGMTSIAFQAAAHVAVGLCIGLAVGEKRWRFAWVAIYLTLVEVAMVLNGVLR